MLPEHPIITIEKTMEFLLTTRPTATKAITTLSDVKVVTEISGRKRDRVFSYSDYLDPYKSGNGN